MALDLTTFAPVLKENYRPEVMRNLSYANNPFLALVPKEESFYGRVMPVPLQWGIHGSRSSSFQTAQAIKPSESGRYDAFNVTRVRDYALAEIDNETLMAAEVNPGAFADAVQSEMNSAIRALTRSLAWSLYRNGTGSIGQVAAGPGATDTLQTVQDITNFEVGMRVVASAADGGALDGAPEVRRITAINRQTGVITWDAVPGWGANRFLYPQGDAQNGGAVRRVAGLDAWLPSAAGLAASPNLFGVVRTQDATRLAGQRFVGAATIKEILIDAHSELAREGGVPDVCLMNPLHMAELVKQLESQVQYDRVSPLDAPEIGFRTVLLQTGAGQVRIISDHNCPVGVAYMLQLDTWKFYSLGPAPMVVETDGLQFLREANSDGIEIRLAYYGNLATWAPGWNMRITLPT
jgi:hypothetical protein